MKIISIATLVAALGLAVPAGATTAATTPSKPAATQKKAAGKASVAKKLHQAKQRVKQPAAPK